jgi:hypothetical protein
MIDLLFSRAGMFVPLDFNYISYPKSASITLLRIFSARDSNISRITITRGSFYTFY